MVGDLCESLIKRDLGKKDAAALMPGFGGLLDLTDSVLYAGPIAYLLWLPLPLANLDGRERRLAGVTVCSTDGIGYKRL